MPTPTLRRALGAALLGIAAASLASPADAGGGPPGGMPPRAVRLGAVEQREVRDEVEAVATVEANRTSVVAAQTDGWVASLPLREGQDVGEGGVLAEIGGEERRLRLAAAEARLAAASAALRLVQAGEREETKAGLRATVTELEQRLRLAQDQADRAASLAKGERPVVDQARADDLAREASAAAARLEAARQALLKAEAGARLEEVEQATAEEARARAERDLADLEVQRSTVRSPFAGRIVRLRTEAGQWLMKGSPVAEVAEISTVFVTAGVGERDYARVARGAPAVVTADAWPDREFAGVVERLVPEAQVATRSFPVRIAVKNELEGLRPLPLEPGMYARARIGVGEPRVAFLVHGDAVVSGPAGTAVFTVAEGRSKRLAVRRGAFHGAFVEVTGEGLAPGLPVIVVGNEVGMTGPMREGETVIPMGGAPAGGPPGAGGPPSGPAGPPAHDARGGGR